MTDHRKVPIEEIKEVRTGDDTEYYRIQFRQPEDLKDRWITLIYISDGTYDTLHLVAESNDACKLWTDAVRKLLTLRQGIISGVANFSVRLDLWERQYFKGSDKSGDQVLDFEEIRQLCRRLNANLTIQELERIFKVIFLCSTREFFDFEYLLGSGLGEQRVSRLSRLPEIRQNYRSSS